MNEKNEELKKENSNLLKENEKLTKKLQTLKDNVLQLKERFFTGCGFEGITKPGKEPVEKQIGIMKIFHIVVLGFILKINWKN